MAATEANSYQFWVTLFKWIGIGVTAVIMLIAGSRGVQVTSEMQKDSDLLLQTLKKQTAKHKRSSLWIGFLSAASTHRICRALLAQGLAGDISPMLERHTPIQKSAFAQPGQRPSPEAHYSSTRIAQGAAILTGRKITLVDVSSPEAQRLWECCRT